MFNFLPKDKWQKALLFIGAAIVFLALAVLSLFWK